MRFFNNVRELFVPKFIFLLLVKVDSDVPNAVDESPRNT